MIDRRGAIGGIGALAAVPLASVADARSTGKPPFLNPGDTVAVVAPASAVGSDDGLDRAEYWLRSMGLVPKFGPHVGDRHGYLAGTDADRAADLNAAYRDPDVKAVFAVRGGWGAARILPLLDWDAIRNNPKLLIGYSDVTALHLAFAVRAGYATIHGGNATSGWYKQGWESLWHLAFAGARPVLGGMETEAETSRPGRTITGGKARGRLLGGNMTILSTLMGTPWVPDFDGAVLFLEDINEAEYRMDRMFQQLRLAGVLDGLAGVVFGQCTRCASTEPDYDGFTVDQVVDQYLAPLGVPAFTGANIGHVANQLSLPSGAEVELDADARTIKVLKPIVG
ncbi:putative murein peptide carboxypeptidase [Tsuneonella dongtanensis]|uniref:Putative murein peptide carboxypeptidase n=1 Tax=Tsuneonella dongtanensis TaxID=692370 RepID=A0A1B2A8S3_9SPHN|nr:LD-carboxypeptidase [Tsuneonella dongtanensis]ANY18569.1 putative murein peptide carboxypeptidase [Tsuneonella dongtanensis]